ncbi:MAG: STAS domain-containing protein [Bacteroidales bacterium]|nr:STAS domain-containing protein [Bacteroidales bacterium]
MKNYTLQKKENLLQITINNNFIVESVLLIKKELDAVIKTVKTIHFELSNIENIDASALQFIFALKQKCTKKGIKLNIKYSFQSGMQSFLNNTGMISILDK